MDGRDRALLTGGSSPQGGGRGNNGVARMRRRTAGLPRMIASYEFGSIVPLLLLR